MRRPTPDAWRGLIPLKEMRGEGEVTNNGAGSFLDEQICASSLASGAFCIQAQPAVEDIVPAVESMKIVSSGKRLDAVTHAGLICLRRPAS